MSATTNLGKVSVTPKGAWANTNTYEILDIVTSGGSSYLAKQDVPAGVPLSNTSYWIMIAEKGDGGEVTSASASISGGYGTPGVTVTAGGTAHERTLAFAFTNLRGEKGETGNGIDSVYKTGTSGLVDTYTILFTDGSTYEFEVNNGTASIDDTLTKSGWAADAKAVGDTKASIDGFYETMGVGVADNLTPYSEDSGASQDIPFIAQGTGCGNGESVVDTGSYCQLKKKLGNTVCVNQQVQNPRFASQTIWTNLASVSGGVGTSISLSRYAGIRQDMSPIVGHTYLLVAEATADSNRDLRLCFFNGATALDGFTITVASGTFTRAAQIVTLFDVANRISLANWSAGAAVIQAKEILCIDLSLWFGSTANIPSHLLSHPEDFGRYYAGALAYNAGTLESADGSILTSIGRNCWDGEWEAGSINSTTGANEGGASAWRTVNYIPVSPNAQYYFHYTSQQNLKGRFYDAAKNYIGFKDGNGNNLFSNRAILIPPSAHFVRFCPADSEVPGHTITVSRYYSGESGYDEDYDYTVLAEVDTGSEVLRSAGKYCDEKDPDGTITRIITSGDLGDLNWAYDNIGFFWANITNLGIIKILSTDDLTSHPISCAAYATTTLQTNAIDNNWASEPNKTIGYHCAGSSGSLIYLYIKDTSYGSDAAAFKTGVTGTKWQYAEATPTTEQGTAFAENIPCDDFGSMYWTQTKGIPQGNEIFYPVDYKASIDTLYNRVEGDMSAIVIDSQLEVVADRIPEAPSEDGTYTLKATVSSGTKTYSWVADE